MGQNVYIQGFETIEVTDMKVYKKVGEHAKVTLIGNLSETEMDKMKASIIEETAIFQIYGKDIHENDKLIFAGILYHLEETHDLHAVTIRMEFVSKSYKMDVMKQKRIFQDDTISFADIISYIQKGYTTACELLDPSINGALGHISLQYSETDWEYIARLISEKNVPMIVEDESDCIYLGIRTSGSIYSIKEQAYTRIYDYDSYRSKTDHDLPVSMKDETLLVVTLREIFCLGSNILGSDGKTYYVYAMEGNYDKFVYKCKYFLKAKEGFCVPTIKNYHMIGASISGSVEKVTADKVQVSLSLDGIQDSKKDLDFATVYSSNEHAGWYCMPEVQDTVNVIFPTEDEREAFVMNAKQIGTESDDPSTKYFRNPSGKEIVFAPDYIRIAIDDQSYIKITDGVGIEIKSDLPIRMSSDQDMKVFSNESDIEIYGQESVQMQRNQTSVTLDKDLTMKAAQIHLKEE